MLSDPSGFFVLGNLLHYGCNITISLVCNGCRKMANQDSSMYNLASAIYSPQIVDAKQVRGLGRWYCMAYAFYYQLVRAAMLVKSDIFLHVRQSVRIERIRLFIR